MGLRDILAADAAAFVNPSDFGETVLYYDGGGDASREVDVLIFREEPAPEQDLTMGARFHVVDVFVARDAERGVLQPTLTDEIELELRPGDATPTRCRVVQIVQRDAGGYLLRVTR
jgi:hypothetical protein